MRRLLAPALLVVALSACSAPSPPNGPAEPLPTPSSPSSANPVDPTGPALTGNAIPKGKLSDDDKAKLDAELATVMYGLDSFKLKFTSAEVGFDISVANGNCAGYAEMNGDRLEFLKANGANYIRAERDVVEKNLGKPLNSDAWALLDGKWLRLPPNAPSPYTDLCDVKSLLEGESEGGLTKTIITNLGPTKLRGKDVIELQVDKGSFKGKILVARTGPLYVVEQEAKSGKLAFSAFNKAGEVKEPSPETVFDLGAIPQ